MKATAPKEALLQIDSLLRERTLDIFQVMINMELRPGESIRNGAVPFDTNITAMIGLAGDLKGFLALYCPAVVATSITSSMLGQEVHELDEDVRDALGEVVNMIAGGVKSGLAETGRNTVVAVPTTIVGTRVQMRGQAGATRCMVPFATATGTFVVELMYMLS